MCNLLCRSTRWYSSGNNDSQQIDRISLATLFRLPVDFTQPVSFLLAIERLERARCTTARETGVSEVDGLPVLRAAVPLARSSLSITVNEKRKGLRAV